MRPSLRQLGIAALLLPLALARSPASAQESTTGAAALRLTPVLEIGGDAAEGAAAFQRVGSVVPGPSGEIYVLDAGIREVRVFGRSGAFVRAFGGAGQGPGEFDWPTRMWVDTAVHVVDARQERVSSFSLAGEHLDTRRLRPLGGVGLSALAPLRDGATVGATIARFSPGTESHSPDIVVFHRAAEAESVDTLIRYRSEGAVWRPRDRDVPWGVTESGFGTGGSWATSGDSLVTVVNGYTGEVRTYAAAAGALRLVDRAELALPSRPVRPADMEALERRWREADRPELGRLTFDAPDRWSGAVQALYSEEGDLWIRSSPSLEEGAIWWVYHRPSGGLRRLRLPAGFALHAVRGQELFGAGEDALGSPIVRVYRLSEPLFP